MADMNNVQMVQKQIKAFNKAYEVVENIVKLTAAKA